MPFDVNLTSATFDQCNIWPAHTFDQYEHLTSAYIWPVHLTSACIWPARTFGQREHLTSTCIWPVHLTSACIWPAIYRLEKKAHLLNLSLPPLKSLTFFWPFFFAGSASNGRAVWPLFLAVWPIFSGMLFDHYFLECCLTTIFWTAFDHYFLDRFWPLWLFGCCLYQYALHVNGPTAAHGQTLVDCWVIAHADPHLGASWVLLRSLSFDHHLTIIWPSFDHLLTIVWPSFDHHSTIGPSFYNHIYRFVDHYWLRIEGVSGPFKAVNGDWIWPLLLAEIWPYTLCIRNSTGCSMHLKSGQLRCGSAIWPCNSAEFNGQISPLPPSIRGK